MSRYVERPGFTLFAAMFEWDEQREPSHETFDEVVAWCADQFGPADWLSGKWIAQGKVVAFRDVEAAFAFKMRWC